LVSTPSRSNSKARIAAGSRIVDPGVVPAGFGVDADDGPEL
jgi:hypothetical protein